MQERPTFRIRRGRERCCAGRGRRDRRYQKLHAPRARESRPATQTRRDALRRASPSRPPDPRGARPTTAMSVHMYTANVTLRPLMSWLPHTIRSRRHAEPVCSYTIHGMQMMKSDRVIRRRIRHVPSFPCIEYGCSDRPLVPLSMHERAQVMKESSSAFEF